jgi:murein DD-endopeptidase MepM/ murein hydrolase activator NlpD
MKFKMISVIAVVLALGLVFRMPASGKLTSFWGIRFLAGNWFHSGSDLGLSGGTPVRPVARGRVALTTSSERWGNYITIAHFPGVTSRYLHLSSIAVSPGDKVSHDTVIGRSGNTGTASTGPHLHFEIRLFNIPLPAYLICLPGKLVGGLIDMLGGAKRKAARAVERAGGAARDAVEDAGSAAERVSGAVREAVP